MRKLLVAALVLAGCVVDPDLAPAPACEQNTDCPGAQTCRDQQCYGGSQGDFSAELFAPPNRADMLARAEIMNLEVSEGGDVGVMFTDSIEVTGRILLRATDATSAAARVVFRRPSRISGAPDYLVTVDALPGKARGEVAFRARLAPNQGNEQYEVTIYPDDGTLILPTPGTPPPNALAPPTVISLRTTVNRDLDITLDSGGLKGLSGLVLDAVGNGMEGMLVRAYGRLTPLAPLDLVSSTGRTDSDGRFLIYLPVARAMIFDLSITPGPGKQKPSLTRKGVRVSEASLSSLSSVTSLTSVIYPALADVATYRLPVTGPVAAGGSREAVGAAVTFTATLATGAIDTVTYQAQATVGSSGLADVNLIPGALDRNRMYKVTVVPLPNAQHGARWDAEVAIGPPSGGAAVLPEMELPRRIFLTGKILDQTGMPAVNMNVRPQLSPSFLASLSEETRARVTGVGLPEVTTDALGTFTVYLDKTLAGAPPTYDLELVPPSASRLPRWSRDGVSVAGTAGDGRLDLGMTTLPGTTLASGTVLDKQRGAPVADAEVRVYLRDTPTTARLRTLARSDKDGKVVLVLPSP